MIDFAYHSGDSIIHRMDPKIKLPAVFILILLMLLTDGIIGTVTAFVLIIGLTVLSKLSFGTVLAPLKRLRFFLILIFLMNSLFSGSGEQCLYSFGPICISRAGILQGYNIVLHILGVSVLSSIYIRTTTSVEVMKSLESCMRPLRVFGVPIRDLALIMSTALQFIPVLFSDIDRIRKAQIARGADFSSKSLADRVRAVFPLVIPAFISAFRRADELSMAIDARGYQSDNPRSD